MSEADAIRSAAELREHVEGVRPYERVLAWTDDQVCCFPVDWPPDESNEDGRFYRLWSDPSDLSIISFDEAREKHKTCQYINVGHVPRVRELVSAVASGRGAGNGAEYVLTFIEFCCSNKSKASDDRYNRPGTQLIRITESEDPTSPEGLRRLLDIIEDPMSGHVVVVSSIPCTLGCTWQTVNHGRKCTDNPKTYCKYFKLQAKHKDRFDKLMTALEAVADALLRAWGDLIHEWGARSMLWNNQRVIDLISEMDLERVYFDGRALNLREPATMKYMRKPWVFYISIHEIIDRFQVARCTCPPRSHTRCKGKSAVLSAFYTWKMTDWVHASIAKRVNSLTGVNVPLLPVPGEAVVKGLGPTGWHEVGDSWVHVQENATRPRKIGPSLSAKIRSVRTSYALSTSR